MKLIMCIYKITNIITNKIYVGQTINFKRRKNDYRKSEIYLSKTTMPIIGSIKKYGWINFSMEILEECDNLFQLNEREKYWITILDSRNKDIGYNIREGGENSTFPQSTRDKMSKAKQGVYDGENNPMFGKNHTIETKNMIGAKNKGKYDGEKNPFYGKTHTEEVKQKISKIKKEQGIVTVGNKKITFEIAEKIRADRNENNLSTKELSEKYRLSRRSITNVLNYTTWKINYDKK